MRISDWSSDVCSSDLMVANTTLHRRSIQIGSGNSRADSGRTHLGALIGDRVRFGASTTLCPGCIVAPGLALPPGVILLGVIDEAIGRASCRESVCQYV